MNEDIFAFGESFQDQQEKNVAEATAPAFHETVDGTYIPGYSEMLKANDIANHATMTTASKEAYFRRWRTQPGPLPFDFMWIRVVGPNGEKSQSAAIYAHNISQYGWRQINVTDEQEFITKYGEQIPNFGFPPAAHIEADGTIRRFDTALFVIDGSQSRTNARKKREYDEWFHGEENSPSAGANTNIPFEAFEVGKGKVVGVGSSINQGE